MTPRDKAEAAEQTDQRTSLKPIVGANRTLRRGFKLQQELALALLPTLTVLVVLALIQAFSNQRLLFASLASSAFLIYLDPQHGTNSTRTLLVAQTTAALTGFLTFAVFGPGYLAVGGAMVTIIVFMILFDAVHPPAVSTALSFAFKAGPESNLLLFGLALSVVVILVLMQRATLWLVARYTAQESHEP